jgi:hypothetical protein
MRKPKFMKQIKFIILALAVFSFSSTEGQTQRSTQQNPPKAGQQNPATRNPAGNQEGNSDQQNPSDLSGDEMSATEGGAGNKEETNSGTGGASAANPPASNAPAIPQTTSSQSGSPSILSSKDGSMRDGTNNVQRATMNMAGSPVRNVKLQNESVNPNSEIAQSQRQRENQPGTVQKEQEPGADTLSGKANADRAGNKINNQSRRQNDELSDQKNAPIEKTDRARGKNTRQGKRKG